MIGERTAEEVKIQIGSALAMIRTHDGGRGRDLSVVYHAAPCATRSRGDGPVLQQIITS